MVRHLTAQRHKLKASHLDTGAFIKYVLFYKRNYWHNLIEPVTANHNLYKHSKINLAYLHLKYLQIKLF